MERILKDTNCFHCNKKLNLFCNLTSDQLGHINESRHQVSFNKGEMICKQGAPMTHILCLTNGLAKVYIESPQNKNLLLKILQPTEIVGGPGFLNDNLFHYSVRALTDARACYIDIKDFEIMVQDNKEFAGEFIGYLNKTSLQLHQKLLCLTQKHMNGRIADVLLYLSEEVYHTPDFVTQLTRQDLADMSAMTKESAIRILSELKEDGVIEYENNAFRILNMDSLKSISRTG